ncbi:unnamed protein product [Ostreobium quekettii]|uniref:Uncharacterized protein n=1 Tax=Ostreobium quekettii TaxID=121088 RepID=A0A8S1JEI1_9CHLO|nr:unnamed protein product [Ostreobium quekettii]|eukprot:evm.model.scf_1004.3 EVM.evm.TU.scf_1004.3   scf_1004:26253-27053(-)
MPPSLVGHLMRPYAELRATFLLFSDPDKEDRWWRSWQRRRLARGELAGASLALASTLILAVVVLGAGAMDPPMAIFILASLAQTAAHIVLLRPRFRGAYEHIRDPAAIALRAFLNPAAAALTRVAMTGTLEPAPGNVLASAVHFLWAFGIIDGAIDALRYPLRFRDHALVQGLAALVWWWADGRLCPSWLCQGARDAVVGPICTAIGALSTGVSFDCRAMGEAAACLTGVLQVQVLLGCMATSGAVYAAEVASRKEFLASGKGGGS